MNIFFSPYKRPQDEVKEVEVKGEIDRSLPLLTILWQTERKMILDTRSLNESIPRGNKGIKKVKFFPFDYSTLGDLGEIEKKLNEKKLKLVDPFTLTQVNIQDLFFSDTYPNGTLWKEGDKVYLIIFHAFYTERIVWEGEFCNLPTELKGATLWVGAVAK